MNIDNEKTRLELWKIEMQLLQNVFNKYDDLIFRSRNWFITLWMAIVGFALSQRLPDFVLVASCLSIIYFILEFLFRFFYFQKYIYRYRALRDHLNDPSSTADSFSLYDLTSDKKKLASMRKKLKDSLFKPEPIIMYLIFAIGGIVLWWLVLRGTIFLPAPCK